MLITDVLCDILNELGKIDMKDSFINSLNAEPITNGLNNEELEGLKLVVLTGVERNDWTALVQHREYIWFTRLVDDCLLWLDWLAKVAIRSPL